MGLWRHIILTGQSNSVNAEDEGAISTATGSYGNMCVNESGNMIQLIEPSPGLANPTTESPSFGIAEGFSSRTGFRVSISKSGWGGASLASISKGGEVSPGVSPYAHSIQRLQNAISIANANGDTIEVPFVALIHGENDGVSGNVNYANNLVNFLNDYNQDIKALTGQKRDVFIVCTSPGGRYPGWGDISSWRYFIENQFRRATKLNPLIKYIGSLDGSDGNQIGNINAHHTKYAVRNHSFMIGRTAAEIYNGTFKQIEFNPIKISKGSNFVIVEFERPVSDVLCTDWRFFEKLNGSYVVPYSYIVSGNEVKFFVNFNNASTHTTQGSLVVEYAYSARGHMRDSDTKWWYPTIKVSV